MADIETVQDAAAKVKADRELLKAENDAYDAELLRSERLRAERIKGGNNVITPPPVVETEHDKWKREAKERYKGTGMDPS